MSIVEAEEAVEQLYPDDQPSSRIYSKPWEVADVCYGNDELKEVKFLQKMTKIRNTYIKNNLMIQQSQDQSKIDKLKVQQAELIKEFAEQKRVYEENFLKVTSGLKNMTQDQKDDAWGEDPDVRYAYVVFRSMEGSDLAR